MLFAGEAGQQPVKRGHGLLQVASRLSPSMVAAGHNVTQEGDEADALYLLQEGVQLTLCLRPQSSTFDTS